MATLTCLRVPSVSMFLGFPSSNLTPFVESLDLLLLNQAVLGISETRYLSLTSGYLGEGEREVSNFT